MKLIRFILPLLMLTIVVGATAQEQIVVVNGKKCIVHTIAENDTFYSLAQRYDVPLKQIIQINGEEQAEKFRQTVSFSSKEFADRLGRGLTGSCESWLGTVTRTEGGGVGTMIIGGKTYKGTELRTLLGLNATAFTITAQGQTVTVTTSGWGHRVGMSQYGADAMAVAGSTYEQILVYYYQGTRIDKMPALG